MAPVRSKITLAQAGPLVVEHALSDVGLFSETIVGLPLYPYQVEPLIAIAHSVLNREGEEYLLVFPRQSGKNEAIAQLLVYLLTVLQRGGGQIVYAAIGDSIGRGMRRLEDRLNTPLTAGRWRKVGRPPRYQLGEGAVVFVSSYPGARSRGETAHHLLVVDEAQDQSAAHIESVFTPMRAATNASAVYMGTTRLASDFLWTKKAELERLTAADGKQRVFIASPDVVIAHNSAYGQFLEAQVRRFGRQHPIIAAEYFLEPLAGAGRLFPDWRVALMKGDHARGGREEGGLYVATIDLAGQDNPHEEGAEVSARRDETVCTIFQIIDGPGDSGDRRPRYHAVDVLVDRGTPHFQPRERRAESLSVKLLAFLRKWEVVHTVVDATGLGQGMAGWLQQQLGDRSVTAFLMSGTGVKARLGSEFLALIETGRFKYWRESDEELPGTDGWWFWEQVAACTYTLPPNGRFDRDLRWGVPDKARASTPEGIVIVHDDRLISASLVVEIDRRLREDRLNLGQSHSFIVTAHDPLVL